MQVEQGKSTKPLIHNCVQIIDEDKEENFIPSDIKTLVA
jgi:hypothetical protein